MIFLKIRAMSYDISQPSLNWLHLPEERRTSLYRSCKQTGSEQVSSLPRILCQEHKNVLK